MKLANKTCPCRTDITGYQSNKKKASSSSTDREDNIYNRNQKAAVLGTHALQRKWPYCGIAHQFSKLNQYGNE
jgi:hypothetical protein